jgi:hypothetical protein
VSFALNITNLVLFVMGKRCVFCEVEEYLKFYYVNFMLQVVKNNYIVFLSARFYFRPVSLSNRHNFAYYMGDLSSNLGQQASCQYLVLCGSSHSQTVER